MQGARNLITCSADGALRDISLLNEFQSLDFSVKNLSKGRVRNEEGDGRLGQVNQFDFSQFRERDWQNVVTCHSNSAQPYLWSYANHSISKVSVKQADSLKNVRVTAVCVSQCGNFGVLGYESGSIQKFNLQSGNDRGLFSAAGVAGQSLHSREVTGLGMDLLNHHLVSCSLDHTIKLWDFYRQRILRTFTHDFPIENLVYNRSNNLIAISTSDLSL